MTTRVDGHSWALSAIDEFKLQKIVTPLNKDIIPITDSPVVVQQHMLPPKKFIVLSAQVSVSFTLLISSDISIKLEGLLKVVNVYRFFGHVLRIISLTLGIRKKSC